MRGSCARLRRRAGGAFAGGSAATTFAEAAAPSPWPPDDMYSRLLQKGARPCLAK